MIIPIYNARKQKVGEFDTSTTIYKSERDYRKGQIFNHPKHKYSMGVDVDILKQLIKLGCKKIQIIVINLKKYSFIKEKGLAEFILQSEEYNADKYAEGRNLTFYRTQRRLPIDEWDDYNPEQKHLYI